MMKWLHKSIRCFLTFGLRCTLSVVGEGKSQLVKGEIWEEQ